MKCKMSAKVVFISFLQYISRAGHEIESPTPSLPTRTLTVVINAAELENKENMEHKVRRGTLIPGKNYMLALMQRTPDICTFCKVELLPFFPSFAFRLQIGEGISSKSRKKTLTERLNKVDKSEMKREEGRVERRGEESFWCRCLAGIYGPSQSNVTRTYSPPPSGPYLY